MFKKKKMFFFKPFKNLTSQVKHHIVLIDLGFYKTVKDNFGPEIFPAFFLDHLPQGLVRTELSDSPRFWNCYTPVN